MAEPVVVRAGEKAESSATPPASEDGRIEFTGERGPLLRLMFKNSLLNLVTLGIYRFWAKTAVRRYFWGNLVVEGSPLEYTGTAKELLIGFLIVLGILVPTGFVFGLASRLATDMGEVGMIIAAVLDLVFMIGFLALFHLAFWRMWRYRLTRTTWRAIRFGLDGSQGRYVALALGWTLATALTLGLAYPFQRMALLRYRLNHTRFGGLPFSFEGKGRALMLVWVPPLLILILAIGLAGVMGASGQLEEMADGRVVLPEWLNSIFTLLGAVMPLWIIYYRAYEFRYTISHTFFGDAGFASSLQPWRVILILIGLGFALAILAVPVFVVAMSPAMLTGGPAGPVLALLSAILLFVAIQVLGSGLVRYEIFRLVCRTLAIHKVEAFHGVPQSPDTGPKRGEGLADAFDVDAF